MAVDERLAVQFSEWVHENKREGVLVKGCFMCSNLSIPISENLINKIYDTMFVDDLIFHD